MSSSTEPVTGTDLRGVAKFERFFRAAASLDIDKDDLRRYNDFIGQKIHDMLLRAEANAQANARDVIEPQDLPIGKGLQECMIQYRRLNEELELQPILDWLAQAPQMDRAPSDETEAELPTVAGGISYALAQTFKVIDPELKNPHGVEWERAIKVFNLIL
jgi:hypothetical protein